MDSLVRLWEIIEDSGLELSEALDSWVELCE